MFALGKVLREIFYPTRCLSCHTTVAPGTLLCLPCRESLLAQLFLNAGSRECLHLDGIYILFRYEDGVKKALHGLKYHHRRSYLEQIAGEIQGQGIVAQLRDTWELCQAIFVVPIPTAPQRYKQRGYDIPSEIFCKWTSQEELIWYPALARNRDSLPQYGLNKLARRHNVQHSLHVKRNVRGKVILLVDDIFTTGATMDEAGRVLKQAGAAAVYALAFAGNAGVTNNTKSTERG